MKKNSYLKQTLFFLLLCASHVAFSQLSKTHYIPPLTSAEFGNANPEDQYMYLSTPSTATIAYKIIPIGQPAANYIKGTLSNTNPQEISLGYGNGQLFVASSQTSTITNNKGYIIEAESPIYVSVRMNAGNSAQAGALVSKGLSALGNIFRIGSYTNENPQSNYLNFASVMATEDNTQVTFSNLPAGLIIQNYNGTTPVNITLNKGESYTMATNAFDSVINRDGLIGCLVSSNKPIVVNCGSANGSFHNGGGRDYGIDQIVGLSKVGTEYVFVKGDGNNAWENVLIVAHSDNTTIRINGNPIVATINAGSYFVIEGNEYTSNGNMYVETSQPVFAYQGVGATTSEANQGLFFVPPLSCETRGNLNNIANIQSIGTTTYTGGITIVTKVGATVTINNLPISNFSVSGPYPVVGKTDYITYKVTGLSGNISVECNDELYSAYFNYNGAATSGSFYSGFPTAPEINFSPQFVTLGNCIPNITFEAANPASFDTFKWLFDDGSGAGFVTLPTTNTTLTPTIPGKYKLVGVISCTGEELESVEIPVSICPDDRDNDGIIDNLDIDNDNDGILNCTESKGNATLNLSNLNAPVVTFQDNTTNATLASAALTTTSSDGVLHTFTSSSNGHFTSTLNPSVDGKNSYEIMFNELVNIAFTEAMALTNTITDKEFFIVRISPVNKNITLLNPDNRLLIDSNFDGVFETGIAQISGSEIHFKINPSPSGNTPYQFLANQITGFSITHQVSNTTSVSIFNGNIALTCFKKDTDFDGVIDEFDLDSDNDGIPDSIENQGILVTLSGNDANADGLDDIFDSNKLPMDSDMDGVPDFYDLDSDNDGIFDVIESGSGLQDIDFDGVIDNIINTIGINGWDDNAETTPDSNQIGYTVNDLDADAMFSYRDADADGDGCTDVIEAGFSDGNNDAFLGDNSPIVNIFGVVTNASNGYTLPNGNYLNFAPISITTQPVNMEVCEGLVTTITLVSSTFDAIKWEVSTDGLNWTSVTNNTIYNNSETDNLTINNTPLTYNGNIYRAFLTRNGNSCGLYSDAMQITVNPLPIVNPSASLIQCDDDIDGISFFNLTEANDKISSNAANETFTYFKTQSAAQVGDETSADYIANPTAYQNSLSPFTDSVWARVTSQFGCASVSEIQLSVGTSQIPNGAINEMISACDDFLDIDGNNNANNDNRDGIATFNFSYVKTMVENFFLPQTPLVTFYRNEADALAEENPITNTANYRNIGYPNAQQIYIRVDSQISNDCQAIGPYITLTVEALPIANPVSIARQCDDDSDGIFPFDTSQIESNVLGTQNPANVTITYTDANGNALPSPLPNPFLTASQTITIRVTNNTTNAPNGPCFDETTLEFIVDEKPIANPIQPQIVCDGSAGDVDDDGLFLFNTAGFESIIKGSQTGMNLYFSYSDENGNFVSKSPTLPNPLLSRNQTITAELINPINTNCTATTTINLIVNPLPDFSIDTPQIVCSSDPTFSIILDPTEANASEPFDYQWLYTSLDGTINNQFLSSNSNVTISNSGTYSVTLTKTDGTGCSKTLEYLVNASEKANISINDVTIVDRSDNNSVSINTANIGNGSYEFALSEVGSNSISYQDEPFFRNVKAGFYTIYVKDAICGITTLNIAVVGHAKFFTPNGDGFNDFWQIKGLNSSFQPNSIIQIFNRYGKLLQQFSASTQGWDGTYHGTLMPTDDYWFKVNLEDGSIYSGHFTLKR